MSGACRKRKSERIDKDIKRPKKDEDPLSSEAAFKRARRSSVANAVEESWDQNLAFDLDEDPTHELWDEAYEKEFQFQKKKQLEHRVSAYQEGWLKESEVDQEEVKNTIAKDKERDKLLVREGRMQRSFADKMHGPMMWEDLSGKTAWVSSNIDTDELDVALQKFNIAKTKERKNADLLVVKDAANMPERVQLFSAALGLTVMDEGLFQGQQGFKVKFKKACGKKMIKGWSWDDPGHMLGCYVFTFIFNICSLPLMFFCPVIWAVFLQKCSWLSCLFFVGFIHLGNRESSR